MNMKTMKGSAFKLSEFSNYCSLHGLKYLGNATLSLYDKVFWLAVLLISLTGSVYLVKEHVDKWAKELTEITPGNYMDTAYNIPFPAITVCAPKIFSESRILKSLRRANSLRDCSDVLATLDLVNTYEKQIISPSNSRYYFQELYDYIRSDDCSDNKSDNDNKTFVKQWPEERYSDLINRFSFSLEDKNPLTISCRFCSYKQNITMKDYTCLTINMVSTQEILADGTIYDFHKPNTIGYPKSVWDIDRGYISDEASAFPKNERYKKMYPHPISSYQDTLIIKNQDHPRQLYHIAFHNPADIPNEFMDWIPVERYISYVLDVEPEITYTENQLHKWLTPDQRGCRYSVENNLKLFKYYTELNCIAECISNAYIEEIGCVPSYLPRQNGMNICLHRNLQVTLLLPSCKCLPSCMDFKYKIKTRLERRGNQTDSKLSLNFKIKYNTFVRKLKYTWKDYLITCIAILDTFLGLSVISIMEVGFFVVCIARRSIHPNKTYPTTSLKFQENVTDNQQLTFVIQDKVTEEHEEFPFKENFSDYCSLHGIKYLMNEDIVGYDRIFWFSVLLCSVGVSLYLLKDELYNWNVGLPIDISPSSQRESVLQLPHPAITVCTRSTLYHPAIELGLKEGNLSQIIDLMDFLELYLEKVDLSKFKRLYSAFKQSDFSHELQLNHQFSNVFLSFLISFDNVDCELVHLDCHFLRHAFTNSLDNMELYFKYHYSGHFNKVLSEFKDWALQGDYKRHSRLVSEPWSEEKYLNFIKRFLAQELNPQTVVCSNGFKEPCKDDQSNYNGKVHKYLHCTCSYSQTVMIDGNQCLTLNMINTMNVFTEQTHSYFIDTNEDGERLDNSTNRIISYEETIIIKKQLANWENHKQYKVALHNPTDVPTEFLEWHELHYSAKNVFGVEVKVTYTEEELRQTTPDLRGCKYPYEENLTMFKYYTEINCLTECHSKTHSKNKGCVPFFLPRPKGSKICITYDLENDTNLPSCKCLPTCNDYKYIIENIGAPALQKEFGTKVSFIFKIDYNYNLQGLKYSWTDYVLTCVTILDTFLGLSLITVVEIVFYLITAFKKSIFMKFQKKIVPIDEEKPGESLVSISHIDLVKSDEQTMAQLPKRQTSTSNINSEAHRSIVNIIKSRIINFELEEFTNCCSLHGLKYLGKRNVSCYEKIFWFIVLMSSFAVSIILLKGEMIEQIDILPVSNQNSILNLPFPALTVCQKEVFYTPSLKKVYKTEILSNLDGINNISEIFNTYQLKASTKNISLSEILDQLDFIESYSKTQNSKTTDNLHNVYKLGNFTDLHEMEEKFKFLINLYFSAYLEIYTDDSTIVYKNFYLSRSQSLLKIIANILDSQGFNSTSSSSEGNDLIRLIRYSRPFEESWPESKYLKFINRFAVLDSPSNTYNEKCYNVCRQYTSIESPLLRFSDCDCNFTQIILLEGSRCSTVNMINASDIFVDHVKHEFFSNKNFQARKNYSRWDVDKGYSWNIEEYRKLPKNIKEIEVYPNRMNSFQKSISVIPSKSWVHLIPFKDITFPTTYKFAIHSPADVPHEAMDWHEINENNQYVFEIETSVISTEDQLKTLPPNKRGCRYSFENNLRYFKYYTEANCLIECMSIIYHSKKGCVPIFLPRPNGTKICLVGELKTDHLHSCNCLPSCTNYNYKIVRKTRFFRRRKSYNPNAFRFKIKYDSFIRKLRYTYMDYIILCITIIDIFLGVSLITVVEVFFYFVLVIRRNFCNIKRDRDKFSPDVKQKSQHETNANKTNLTICISSEKPRQHNCQIESVAEQSINIYLISENLDKKSRKKINDTNISVSPSNSLSITSDHQARMESPLNNSTRSSFSGKSVSQTVEPLSENIVHSFESHTHTSAFISDNGTIGAPGCTSNGNSQQEAIAPTFILIVEPTDIYKHQESTWSSRESSPSPCNLEERIKFGSNAE